VTLKLAETSPVRGRPSVPYGANLLESVSDAELCVCVAGKLKDPEFHQYLTPHSCGEVCRRQRDKHCPHRCNVLCHPGPCPPCQAFTTKSCACGKTRQTVKCASAAATRCDKACDKTRNCGKHICQSVCHEGSCDPCSETISQVLETVVHVNCGAVNIFKKYILVVLGLEVEM